MCGVRVRMRVFLTTVFLFLQAFEKRTEVEELRVRNEKLVYNILPVHVANYFLQHQSKDETVSWPKVFFSYRTAKLRFSYPHHRDTQKCFCTFIPPKLINFPKLKNKQHHSKVLLNSFPGHGHT